MRRVKYNHETMFWDVQKKEMLFIGKLTWTIERNGFNTKQEAFDFIKLMEKKNETK